jgi:hypothetical protein
MERVGAVKRLLLVIVLVAVCLGLLASPALAAPVLEDGVYVWIYGDFGWMQWQNPDGWIAFGDPEDPIPAGQKVWLMTAWATYGYGLIRSIDNTVVETLSLNGQPVVATAKQSKALWSQPYPSDGLAPGGAFNPNVGAKGYMAVWLYPVAQGTYTVTGTETFTHSCVDLMFIAENRPGPNVIPAGTSSFGSWTLVVP